MLFARRLPTSARLTVLLSMLLQASCAVSKPVDGCSSIKTAPLAAVKQEALPSAQWSAITIGSQVQVPFLRGERYLLDTGPIVSSVSDSKSITYRLIGEEEIAFIGSDKSPADYFTNAFRSPTGLECAFTESFRKATEKWHSEINGFDVYVFSENTGYKAYLVSSQLDFVTELFSDGLSLDELTLLIQNAHILK